VTILTPTEMANGGSAVARDNGMVFFVEGAIPGDVVEAEVVAVRKRYGEARTIRVIDPSPQRVTPPCQHFGDCGGCQWQMGSQDAQVAWKQRIVEGQLRHLAGLHEVEVRPCLSPSPAYGYRNRMDFRVVGGRPALTAQRSNRPVGIEVCHLMAPPLHALFEGLGSIEGTRVTLRAGINTGETLVMVDEGGGRIHEIVGGHRFRITGKAFFQINTQGAEALVELVREALAPKPGEVLVDGYAGGGLFAATVGAACDVVAVESEQQALGDLGHNTGSRVVASTFEHSRHRLPELWDLTIVDPPRTGLRGAGVSVAVAGHPRAVAYVSCDPASFARDARLFAEHGYFLEWVQPFDLFPQTFHIELVARLRPMADRV
jgi:tRNA/tmRNA/rRNA uracil-C5-methylase (TrmA/RlmC/RlmD family)